MTWPEGSGQERPGKSLDPTARTILIVWAVLAVGLAGVGIYMARDLDGWEGLVVVIYVIVAIIALVAIGVSALIVRGMVVTRTSQILAAVLLPPGLTMAVVTVLMVIG